MKLTIYQVGEMSLSLYAVGNDPVESEKLMTQQSKEGLESCL